jgi:FMN reductase (NADPH)
MKRSETMEIMQNHRSFRKFTDEVISKEQIKELIRSGQGAASSHFVQAYSIIHVVDKEKREKIAEVAKQRQVAESPVFLLFCADLKRLEYAAEKHNSPFQYDTAENFIVTCVDTALVAQNVLLAAESVGYGGCFVGGVRNNLEAVSEVVQLPDKVFPLFGMTLGVPAKDQEVKPRLPVDVVLHEDVYDNSSYSTALDSYDEVMNEYFSSRSSNRKAMNWTMMMADFYSKKNRAYIKDFLAQKGFHFN